MAAAGSSCTTSDRRRGTILIAEHLPNEWLSRTSAGTWTADGATISATGCHGHEGDSHRSGQLHKAANCAESHDEVDIENDRSRVVAWKNILLDTRRRNDAIKGPSPLAAVYAQDEQLAWGGTGLFHRSELRSPVRLEEPISVRDPRASATPTFLNRTAAHDHLRAKPRTVQASPPIPGPVQFTFK
jgi:hypothetical protein